MWVGHWVMWLHVLVSCRSPTDGRGKKIEFTELAFWKFNFYFFSASCHTPTGLDRKRKNKYAERAFQFHLGQQVALLCADKTTGNWKLNSWNLKWILILKISENEYSHQWCQFQFSIFTKIEWPQYTLTPITSIFEIWVVWTVILNWHYHGNINNSC